MKPVHFLRALAAANALALLGGCGSGDSRPGTVRFALTDAPACGFDHVSITVERVRIHRSAEAGENASGWTDLRLSPARRIDLLKLQNGVVEELGQLALPAGRYGQLRLVPSPNGGGAPANAVVPTGGTETMMEIPSGAQAGIKLASTVVDEGKLTDVLFDFDACRAVVPKGNEGYVLKPVVRLVPRSGATVSGYVDPMLAGVTESAQKAGRVLRETVADANGRFVLAFLDAAASPVDVVFTAAGRTTAVVSGVTLAPGASTELSRMDAPVALLAAAERRASGTVGPVAARESAVVRALQAVGAAGTVEVATVNANGASGAYALDLPTAQPRLAAYSTRLPLSFSATGLAARYTLEASAEGYQPQTQAADLGAAALTRNPTLARR